MTLTPSLGGSPAQPLDLPAGLSLRERLRRHAYSLRAHGQALRWNRFEFSLGLLSGPSLDRLKPLRGVPNPILTKNDVTDISCGFVADPFLLRRNGLWYVFFEVWNNDREIGEIACAVSRSLAEWRYLGLALTRPEHLSYPQVFTWEDEVYMVPESAAAGITMLYRAVDFPLRWEPVGPLMDAPLVDASLFRHEGLWWMFAETSPDQGHSELRLYMADAPGGPWRPHPQNPLMTGDPMNARPAGRVFAEPGCLIRFAQECEPDYGTAVRAFRIAELTPERYREEGIPGRKGPRLLGPSRGGWNNCGMHHIDLQRLDNGQLLACVDGR